jgi:catechol 2,3-dioxygenase-like lactoylglutathione lyase family enzyme
MTTSNLITGLHHVTAMASSPQQNVDFYVGILGLRLVKKPLILMRRMCITFITEMRAVILEAS